MSADKHDASSSVVSRVSLPPAPLDRATVDKYEVIYPLGQGGMASVHVGRLSGIAGFEKLVAIKVVHRHLMNEQAFLDMFLDEARLAAQIKHPNVAEIYALGEEAGLYYMVGELVLGQNLRTLAHRAEEVGKPLSFGMIAHICAEVCRGLHAAHEVRGPDGELLGLVHRDVSPRNVLVAYSGHVKLIDFGVAWAKGKLSHTRSGAIKGKMAYMPPEQLRGFRLDRRSDIYSLGVVLYLLATGSHPFPGSTSAERMTRIVEGKFRIPREVRPDVPEELERIVLEAMSYSAEDRFETAEAMAEELEAFARNSGDLVGAGALGRLMAELFRDEMLRHDELMRVYRRTHVEGEHVVSQARPLSPVTSSNAPLPGSSTDDVDATCAGTPKAIATRRSRRLPRRKLVAIAGSALTLSMVTVLWFFIAGGWGGSTSQSPSVADVASSAEKPKFAPLSVDSADAVDSAAKISIRVNGLPRGARLSLDGRAATLDDGALVLVADDTEHMLEIEADGYLKRSVVFTASGNQVIEAGLRPIESPAGKTAKHRDSSAKSANLSSKKGSLRRNPYQ